MAKDPILPLYYNDITTSTQDWTDEEFGAYMRLLIHQWRQGGLPNDYQRLTRIATSLPTTWPLIKQKFAEVDGMLKNPVMEEIREKRAKHKEKQSENVRKRYQTYTKHPTKNLPLEKENEIEKEKLNTDKGDADFQDYEKWTDDVISGSDFLFAPMIRNKGVKVNGDLAELARSHLALLAKYPNMRPTDQHRFRTSLIGHIEEKSKVKPHEQAKGTTRTTSAIVSGKDYGASKL